MSNTYPRKFDTSELSSVEQKIITDFHERRKIFDKFISDNELKISTCPSCGYPTLGERGSDEICSVCDWEDDNQDDPKSDQIWGGPNLNLSLTESRLQIGKALNELSENLKGTVNLNPDEVIKTLKTRDEKIETFLKEKITMTTHIDNPVWKEYSQLRKDTLVNLITKPL